MSTFVNDHVYIDVEQLEYMNQVYGFSSKANRDDFEYDSEGYLDKLHRAIGQQPALLETLGLSSYETFQFVKTVLIRSEILTRCTVKVDKGGGEEGEEEEEKKKREEKRKEKKRKKSPQSRARCDCNCTWPGE